MQLLDRQVDAGEGLRTRETMTRTMTTMTYPEALGVADATRPVVLNEDKIVACVRCGKPFANQRIIDNMLGKLATHSMFKDPAALRRLQMCQDCRVVDLFEKGGDGTIFDVTDKG